MNRYIKERIIFHYYDLLQRQGHFHGLYTEIARKLAIEEHALIDRRFVRQTVLTYRACGKTYRENNGRPKRLTNNRDIRNIIDDSLKENDEITGKAIKTRLERRGYDISITTINRIKRELGWTLKGTGYCQLIRHANKPKRIQWVRDNLNDQFDDVIWTDETSVWMEQHCKRSYRKKGVTVKRKPKPKYPLKVHVWAGISRRGSTEVCIFKGIMDASLYTNILENTLLPFIRAQYPVNHRFMQDNDPKHSSNRTKTFLESNNINWWKTPAESPDLNPIENVWHEMKEHIRRKVKPRTEGELIAGILTFWDLMTVEKCNAYINHLRKVMPEVLRMNGEATRY